EVGLERVLVVLFGIGVGADGVSLVHRAQALEVHTGLGPGQFAGGEEQSLRQRGLAGKILTDQRDVADIGWTWCGTDRHKNLLLSSAPADVQGAKGAWVGLQKPTARAVYRGGQGRGQFGVPLVS